MDDDPSQPTLPADRDGGAAGATFFPGGPTRVKSRAQAEFGDFQTPEDLAQQVCALLRRRGVAAEAVIEPTCGVGGFLVAAAAAFPQARLLGWEIRPDYVVHARDALAAVRAQDRATVTQADFFDHAWEEEFSRLPGRLLILGNLPWVTNAAVGRLSGSNLPVKGNQPGWRGIDALTGRSNFDIAEWMLRRLGQALQGRCATLAVLCKTNAARRFLRQVWQNKQAIAEVGLYRIDAARHFAASVDACLLLGSLGADGPTEAGVYQGLNETTPTVRMGLVGSHWVADLPAYRRWQHLDGVSTVPWRSGVKHDCAAVMELRRSEGTVYENGLGERVSLEPDYVFPLLKCSDLAHGRSQPTRCVLVPQRRVGEATSGVEARAPNTWRYLVSHRARLEARKSSIYRGKPPFALFGIGDYSFAPWKVAVSGLHHSTRFTVVGPVEGRPVMLDDTSYFLAFAREESARVVAAILAAPASREFLASLRFEGTKRPITSELLNRLDLDAMAQEAGLAQAWSLVRPAGMDGGRTPDPHDAGKENSGSNSLVGLARDL